MKELEKRFWKFVLKPKNESASKCWAWVGGLSNGYGMFWFDGRMYLAHRVAWELAHGDSQCLKVRHTCGNRDCVRPGHLYTKSRKRCGKPVLPTLLDVAQAEREDRRKRRERTQRSRSVLKLVGG